MAVDRVDFLDLPLLAAVPAGAQMLIVQPNEPPASQAARVVAPGTGGILVDRRDSALLEIQHDDDTWHDLGVGLALPAGMALLTGSVTSRKLGGAALTTELRFRQGGVTLGGVGSSVSGGDARDTVFQQHSALVAALTGRVTLEFRRSDGGSNVRVPAGTTVALLAFLLG